MDNLTAQCNLPTFRLHCRCSSHPQGKSEVRCEIDGNFIGVAPVLVCPCGLATEQLSCPQRISLFSIQLLQLRAVSLHVHACLGHRSADIHCTMVSVIHV